MGNVGRATDEVGRGGTIASDDGRSRQLGTIDNNMDSGRECSCCVPGEAMLLDSGRVV